MARYVKHGRDHPFAVKLADVPGLANLTNDEKLKNFELHMCACGLSKHKPFCDGSHMKVQNEKKGVAYAYKENNTPVEGVKIHDSEENDVEVPNEYE